MPGMNTYCKVKFNNNISKQLFNIHRLCIHKFVNTIFTQLSAIPALLYAAKWQARTPDELKNLTALAQAAVGFNTARGDLITVQDLAFDGNRPEPAPALPAKILSRVESSPLLIKYATLLVGLLMVLALGLRPALGGMHGAAPVAKGKKGKKGAAAPAPEQLAAEQAAALAAELDDHSDAERLRGQAIFEKVSGHVKREPAQSSRLLQSWIHSDGS